MALGVCVALGVCIGRALASGRGRSTWSDWSSFELAPPLAAVRLAALCSVHDIESRSSFFAPGIAAIEMLARFFDVDIRDDGAPPPPPPPPPPSLLLPPPPPPVFAIASAARSSAILAYWA